MSALVHSIPGQTEGRRKAFLEWSSSYKPLGEWVMLTIKKVFINLFLLQGKWKHQGNFQYKSVISPFGWVGRYILFLPKLKGRGRPFLRGVRRVTALLEYTLEYLVLIRDEKVNPFVKFEIIVTLLCFLLDFLTKKHCRPWSSMINLWIDFRASKVKNPAVRKPKV